MCDIVQYVIVRGDLIKCLRWPKGAVVAQCCHATTAVDFLYKDDQVTQEYFKDLDNMHKIILEAPEEKDLRNLHLDLTKHKILHKLWIEKPENIATCLAIKPYHKDCVYKFVKQFKLFK